MPNHIESLFGLKQDPTLGLAYFRHTGAGAGKSYAAIALQHWFAQRMDANSGLGFDFRRYLEDCLDFPRNRCLITKIPRDDGRIWIFTFNDESHLVAREIPQDPTEWTSESRLTHVALPIVFHTRSRKGLPSLSFHKETRHVAIDDGLLWFYEAASGRRERVGEPSDPEHQRVRAAWYGRFLEDITIFERLLKHAPDLKPLQDKVASHSCCFQGDFGALPIPPDLSQTGLTRAQQSLIEKEMQILAGYILRQHPDKPSVATIVLRLPTRPGQPIVPTDLLTLRSPNVKPRFREEHLNTLFQRANVPMERAFGFSISVAETRSRACRNLSLLGTAQAPVSAHDYLELFEAYGPIDFTGDP